MNCFNIFFFYKVKMEKPMLSVDDMEADVAALVRASPQQALREALSGQGHASRNGGDLEATAGFLLALGLASQHGEGAAGVAAEIAAEEGALQRQQSETALRLVDLARWRESLASHSEQLQAQLATLRSSFAAESSKH